MKKQLTILLLLSVVFFTACDPDVEPSNTLGNYTKGVMIINEGNFGSNDGEISFYLPESEAIYHNVYKGENGLPFAGLIQSVEIAGDTTYLTDNTGKVQVVVSRNFKRIGTIEGFTNPRDFVKVNGKGFVADWGPYAEDYSLPSSYIFIIDLETFEKVDSIAIASAPEHFKVVDNKIFVSSTYSDVVSVIDANTLATETITVPYGPSEMVVDKNDKIWVVCSSHLARLNTNTLLVEDEISFSGNGTSSGDLEINQDGDQLYYLTIDYNDDLTNLCAVYGFGISSEVAPSESIIDDADLYGIGIDEENQIYVADHKNYAGNGEVRIYNTTGELQKTIEAGRIPSDFIFLK